MDFIFFLYGLSFLIFSAVCVTVRQQKGRMLPWGLLGAFGLSHGVNEILDMFASGIGEVLAFSLIRIVVLVASYVFMCEAAVHMASGRWMRRLSYLWYLGAAFFCHWFLGRAGLTGVNAAARYFLGFPGVLATALFVLRASASVPYGRNSLRWMAVSLGVYAFATGLVVPEMRMWPADIVNHAAFLKLFHFPVQLLRCACAIGAAVSVWYYSQAFRAGKRGPSSGPSGFFGSSHVIVVLLSAVVLLGLLATEFSARVAYQMLSRESRDNLSTISNYLQREFRKVEEISRVMSTSSPMVAAAAVPSPENISNANEVLDRYAAAFRVSVAYLMDKGGTVIASSNRNSPQSFVGKSYAFRPYFIDAASGGVGRYFAVGVTSHERGYYAASPVFSPAHDVIGVVTIKFPVSDIEGGTTGAAPFYVFNNQGMVFISNEKEAVCRPLWPLFPSDEGKISDSRQFGGGPFLPVFPERFSGDSTVMKGDSRYYALTRSLEGGEWHVLLLEPLDIVWHYRLFSICITLFLCVLIIAFFVIVRQKENLLQLVMQEKERAQQYLDIAGVMILVLDRQARIMLINSKGCGILGCREQDVLGKDWVEEFIPEDTKERIRGLLEKFLADQPPDIADNENPVITRRGELRTIGWHNVVLRDERGRAVGILSSGEDITVRKAQEEQLKEAYTRLKEAQQELIQSEKMAAVGQLAAGVSHELNQPLTGIRGFAQSILIDIGQESPHWKDLQRIVEQADRMDRIIKNVRFFARRSEFHLEEIYIGKPIMDSMTLLVDQLRIRNINISADIPENLPPIEGDLTQLQQVFLNLFTNARDAIESRRRPEGGNILVKVSLTPDNLFLRVSVHDDGCGIPKENQESIFNPFFTTKSPDGGMGLGLAIVYRIVDSHKGSISVESREGEGSTFSLQFPVLIRHR